MLAASTRAHPTSHVAGDATYTDGVGEARRWHDRERRRAGVVGYYVSVHGPRTTRVFGIAKREGSPV
jgi:hypothetical protein